MFQLTTSTLSECGKRKRKRIQEFGAAQLQQATGN
jgi:hypothetical protein